MKRCVVYVPYILALLILMAVVYWMWLYVPKYTLQQTQIKDKSWQQQGAWGDQFGAFNALFSAFAFSALILTLIMQMNELRLQREEIEENRKELTEHAHALAGQVEISALSAKLASLPGMIRDAELILTGFNEKAFGRGAIECFSDERISDIIKRFRDLIHHNDDIFALLGQTAEIPEYNKEKIIYSPERKILVKEMDRDTILKEIPNFNQGFKYQIDRLGKLQELKRSLIDNYEKLSTLENEFRIAKESASTRAV